MPCLSDSDCSVNELCYTNTSYFEQLQGNHEDFRLLGCDCNAWFGWTGPLCKGFTFETFFFAAIVYLLALINFLAGFTAFFVFQKNLSEQTSWKEANSRLTTSLFTLMSCVGIFIWSLFLCLSHFITAGAFIGDSFPYKARYNLFLFYGASIGTSFLGAASINVCFIWLEIANKSTSSSTSTVSQLKKYRWVLYALFLVGIISITVLRSLRTAGNEGPNQIGLFFAPLFLGILIAFKYSGNKLKRLLQKFQQPPTHATRGPEEEIERPNSQRAVTHYTSVELEPQLQQAIRNIRITSRVAIISFGAFSVAFFLFSVIDVVGYAKYGGLGWRNSVHPGSSFPTSKLLFYIGIMAETLMNANLARYIFREQTHRD